MRAPNLAGAITWSISRLKTFGVEVDTGHWQGVDTGGKPDLVTREVLDLRFTAAMPGSADEAVTETGCNMPWAEDHFQERVSREPSNPGEQYKNWPWWHDQTQAFDPTYDTFSHTYQERFWPKYDGERDRRGIRYPYGDLDDVLRLLHAHPMTRQATFPIFFPEDTGAIHGGRIPCTLHYHFLRRAGLLHLWYPIRSCDAVRHFRDDIYMAVRLCQWVIDELQQGDDEWDCVVPGNLHFAAYSFHVHKGDEHLL